MYGSSNATPLTALDAVILDLETTGLDPSKARVLEVAVIRIAGGDPAPVSTFEQRVNPGEAIPRAATAIHGIDDAAVANAPVFAQIWLELAAFLADSVVVGHSIGYDLIVLRRECERRNLVWKMPRALDVRLLAEVVKRDLPDYSLEQLADWLNIEPGKRHSAFGDALTAARIFAALLPKLRERSIRTLAEAEHASRKLTVALDRQYFAGWSEVAPTSSVGLPKPSRIDPYPYRHRVCDVMSAPARFIAPELTLTEALDRMTKEQISSVYIRGPGSLAQGASLPAQSGILTERDLMRAVAKYGGNALAMPVSQVMSAPISTIPADAFVYQAIARMNRLKFRHLGATAEDGQIVGALSARDLLRLSAEEAISLDDEIDHASNPVQLGRAWVKLSHAVASLVAEGFSGSEAAAVISRELGALTARAAALAEQHLIQTGHGEAPCAYAIAVLGSAGREESLLALDQDNAIVFEHGDPGGPSDRWFERLGVVFTDILNEVGVPYCKGGIMARNPQWRGSLQTWRRRIRDWINHPIPEALLSVDIFFDLRAVHGDKRLADTIWREAFDVAKDQVNFVKLLSEAAGAPEAGLNFFGQVRTRDGRIDLKKSGLFGIVSFARALAIRHHIVLRSTPARLAAIRALRLGSDADLDMLAEAQALFLDLILQQQLEDLEVGVPPTNAVSITRLSRSKRDRLRGALQVVDLLDVLKRDLLFAD